ncbi:MAG TPA: PIN domain nuclease [Burkholderiales bacterium]|nr:PIN domain nuclease [Burkholderiales bacterium]
MILVDTSVLVDYLEGRDSPAARRFDEVLERGIPFGISPLTYMEILQGAATEKDFNLLDEYLGSQTLYALKPGPGSYAAAAKVFFRLRKAGLAGPSTVDCLIAQTAIEYGLFLLHSDSDFDRIAKIAPLKMW